MEGKGADVVNCPKCGYSNADNADFCANPDCQTYLGFATGVSNAPAGPPRPTVRPNSPGQRVTPGRPVVGVARVGGHTVNQPPQPPPDGQRRGVRLRLEPERLAVDPGGVGTATVSVRNTGTRVEDFGLVVTGSAAVFTTVEPARLSVYPDSEESAVLRFSPRRSPQHPAGEVPYTIYARSVLHADAIDMAHGAVTVAPFHEMTTALKPESSRGRRGGLHRLQLGNAGNAPFGVQVALSDRDSVLRFEPPQIGTTLAPGQNLSLPVRVSGPRRWFGRTQPHPFTALVTPAGQPPVMVNGIRHQVPMFPWWIPTAALVLVALLIAVIALLPADKVPSTTGLAEVAATKVLDDAGYRVVVIPQPHPSIKKGLAIKTDPPSGAELDEGEIVQLFVSTGPCTGECPVEIPEVEGLSQPEAEAALKAAGFAIGRVNKVKNDAFPEGIVIGTKPPAGTERPRGSELVLNVSTGDKKPGGEGEGVEIPQLRGHAAAAATEKLTGLGFKVKPVEVHSNDVPKGRVLSTDPAAGNSAEKGTEVVLHVARPTEPIDLMKLAPEATWRSAAGVLPFPGNDGDTRGFVLIREDAQLEDGTVDDVLETHPEWVAGGEIRGRFQLAESIVRGDHLRAEVGMLGWAGGNVDFVVMSGGQQLGRVNDGADGKLKKLDVDLSPAQGSRTIEIVVLAGVSSGQDWAIWRDLRIEGRVG